MDNWIDIEKEVPKWKARDVLKGYTQVEIKDATGKTWFDGVTDHQIWYYLMKDLDVTYWRYVSE